MTTETMTEGEAKAYRLGLIRALSLLIEQHRGIVGRMDTMSADQIVRWFKQEEYLLDGIKLTAAGAALTDLGTRIWEEIDASVGGDL